MEVPEISSAFENSSGSLFSSERASLTSFPSPFQPTLLLHSDCNSWTSPFDITCPSFDNPDSVAQLDNIPTFDNINNFCYTLYDYTSGSSPFEDGAKTRLVNLQINYPWLLSDASTPLSPASAQSGVSSPLSDYLIAPTGYRTVDSCETETMGTNRSRDLFIPWESSLFDSFQDRDSFMSAPLPQNSASWGSFVGSSCSGYTLDHNYNPSPDQGFQRHGSAPLYTPFDSNGPHCCIAHVHHSTRFDARSSQSELIDPANRGAASRRTLSPMTDIPVQKFDEHYRAEVDSVTPILIQVSGEETTTNASPVPTYRHSGASKAPGKDAIWGGQSHDKYQESPEDGSTQTRESNSPRRKRRRIRPPTRVRCNQCKASFTRDADLRRHLYTIHSALGRAEILQETRPSVRRWCEGCEQILARADARRRHETACLLYQQMHHEIAS